MDTIPMENMNQSPSVPEPAVIKSNRLSASSWTSADTIIDVQELEVPESDRSTNRSTLVIRKQAMIFKSCISIFGAYILALIISLIVLSNHSELTTQFDIIGQVLAISCAAIPLILVLAIVLKV